MQCSIINQTQFLLMKHLVIGQRQKAPNFSAFHWSPHGSLVSIGQHFVTKRVVHLPKRIEISLITEADLITESDQAMRAVRSAIVGYYQPLGTHRFHMPVDNFVLTLKAPKKNCSRRYFNCLLLFSQQIRLDFSRESSA